MSCVPSMEPQATACGSTLSLRRRSLQATLLSSHESKDPQIFTTAAPPYTITHVNAAWETLCGFEAREVIGKTCQILQGPDTSREALKVLHQALRQLTAVSVRLLNYTKQGTAFLNDLTVEPLEDGGVVAGFVGAIYAWRPPEALPEYPRTFETPDEAVTSNDIRISMPKTLADALNCREHALVITEKMAPFRITHVNEAWCALCGYDADEAIGQKLSMLQGPGTCQATLRFVHKAAETCTSITVRLLNFTKVCSRPPVRLACARPQRYTPPYPFDSRIANPRQPPPW